MATLFPFIYPPNLSTGDVTTHGLKRAGWAATRRDTRMFSKGLRATHRRIPTSPSLPRGVGFRDQAHPLDAVKVLRCANNLAVAASAVTSGLGWRPPPPSRGTLSPLRDPDRATRVAGCSAMPNPAWCWSLSRWHYSNLSIRVLS